MRTLFIDCNEPLRAAWDQVCRPDDPPIDVNMAPFAREAAPDLLAGYQVCIDDHSYFTEDILRRCRDLEHIVFLGTGAASYIDLPAAERLGIGVSIIKGYGDTAVAEHTVALMMAAARDVARQDRAIRGGHWEPREGMQLRGKVLGLLGLGGIGAEVARIAAGIGMQVIAWTRTKRPEAGIAFVELPELLRRADILSLHLTLSEETRGLIGDRELAQAKPGVILVNTARGALLDEAALVSHLRSRHIRHAALDVFADEPLKPDHPLTGLDDVTLTAHSAFSTPDSLMTLLRRSIDLARDVMAQAK